MILTFLLGAAAGFAAPYLEPHLRSAMAGVSVAKIEVEESEFDLLALVLLLLLAALVTGGGSSLALLLGALVGVFGKRIVTAIQSGGSKE